MIRIVSHQEKETGITIGFRGSFEPDHRDYRALDPGPQMVTELLPSVVFFDNERECLTEFTASRSHFSAR